MTNHELLSGIEALASKTDNGTAVHGILIGEGDITTGLSGKRTRWTAEALQEMEGLLEGKPITLADSLDPEQHVGVEMTDSGPRITGAVSMDEKVGEITRDVYEEGVGILYEGFVANDDAKEAVEAGLAQVSPVVVRELEEVEAATDENEALYEPSKIEAVRDLAIVADGAAPSNEINSGTAEALSNHFDVDVSDPDADGGGGDDGPNGNEGQSTPATDWRTTMSDDLTDKERELLARAGQLDDPTVVEAGRANRLAEIEEQHEEYEELLEDAQTVDDPTVESAETAEAMRDRVAIVEEMMAEALAEQKGLKEETVEAMSFEAKAAEFTNDDGDLELVEALTQSPESGSGPSGGDPDGPSEEDIERIGEINTKIDLAGTALPRERIEALQEEACDLAGVDDYSDAVEVL